MINILPLQSNKLMTANTEKHIGKIISRLFVNIANAIIKYAAITNANSLTGV